MYTLLQHNYFGGCCSGGNNTRWTLRVFNFSKEQLKTFIHMDNQEELESVCYLRDIDKLIDRLIEQRQFGEWCGDDCHAINQIFLASEEIVLKDADLQKEKFPTIEDIYCEFFLSRDGSDSSEPEISLEEKD